jgi:hypothetical protein
MEAKHDAAALAECIAPLDEEDRRAVRRYWEQVIREELVPAVRVVPRPVPLEELDERRERRAARRAVASVVRLAARRGPRELHDDSESFGPEAA